MSFSRNFGGGYDGGGGFNSNNVIDQTILDMMRELGYNVQPTEMAAEYVVNNFTPRERSLTEGRVPGYQDANGNFYVVLDTGVVYRIGNRTEPEMSGPTPTGNGGGEDDLNGGGEDDFIEEFEEEIINRPPNPIGSGKIYSRFDIEDMVLNNMEIVTRALWSDNKGMLTEFFTGSGTTSQKRHYYEIFNTSASAESCLSEPQFSVAYGNIFGSGSNDYGGQIEDTPTRAIYGQYRQLCLEDGESGFNIKGNVSTGIYAININRARMLEYIDEGNIEINIAHLSGSEFIDGGGDPNSHTGSNVTLNGSGDVLRLVDDSRLNQAEINSSAGEIHDIVSGSIEDGVYNSENPVVYGKLYKRLGIVILDSDMLDASASFGTVTGREVEGDNAFKLFTAISGAADFTDGTGDDLGFSGRGAELVKSSHYYCRVKNSQFNFSNNPTFVTGSFGELRHPDMRNNPTTYITTVGLYNKYKELLAVAKLSRPLRKDFTEDTVIKVKMDY